MRRRRSPPRRPRPGRWPEGDEVGAAAPTLAALLADPALAGPGMRALVVLHRGRIVAERYGDGFDAATPLLGWSMTKTVTAALVGTLVRDGRIAVEREALFPAWAGDERRRIAMAQPAGHVQRPELQRGLRQRHRRHAHALPGAGHGGLRAAAAAGAAGGHASSTTPAAAACCWRGCGRTPLPGAALAWPRQALFDPLGMRSAVMEADARGTFVGSSYLYATGRDWARFALLLLQDGQWQGQALLPADWVARMRTPSKAAPHDYTEAPDVAARPACRHARRARTPTPASSCRPTRCG